MTRTDGMRLGSGIGLVVANMVGAGVLISAGFMVQTMTAGALLGAWVLGLLLALCGARAYAELASTVEGSGGEYRYLTDLLHPYVGRMAGWGSLLIGFSGPIAIDATAIGAFLATLGLSADPRWTGTAIVILVTLIHGLRWKASTIFQNVFVAIKVVLILGFVAIGLHLGSWAWPTWAPPDQSSDVSSWGLILENQFWIAFAFSGWNAAIYAAGDFKNPRRDVGRAMLIGCTAVGITYLLINWIFVANITPDNASVVFRYGDEYVTLGHVLVVQLLGPEAARWMSALVILALFSAISAMMLVAPRIYAEMAKDGGLPVFFKPEEGRPPLRATLLQAAVAILLIHTHSILEAVESSSSVLMIFTSLSIGGLFTLRRRPGARSPSPTALVVGAVYILLTLWILWQGLTLSGSYKTLLLLAAVMVAAAVFRPPKTSPVAQAV